MAKDPHDGRRRFMKDSVLSFARAAHEFVKHRDAPSDKTAQAAPPPRTDWLRPPGSVTEPLFLERCTRCGDCVKACPYGSITVDQQNGLPVIYPDAVPCYLCDDFPCIAACETEALLPVGSPAEVRMGLAVVSHRDCTAGQGCHACVSRCPTGALGMDFETFRVGVSAERCVGCGLCEQTCKTVNDTIAIRVVPARLLVAKGQDAGVDRGSVSQP